MKTKNIALSFLLLLALVSCKNEAEKTVDASATEKTELKETFDVSFTVVVPKDDTLQLFYTQDGSLNFGDDRSVRSVVKGSDQPQEVLFKLPADVLPTNVRLDLGENPEQGNIAVNAMNFKYLKNSYGKIFGANEQLTHYFYQQDAQVKLNDANHTAELLKPKGQAYDPMIWSNQLLSEEMIKLYKN